MFAADFDRVVMCKHELKDKVLTESLKLFSRVGIKNATMDEIARQLGVSKKTLYEQFDNKSELVYQLMCREMEVHLSLLNESAQNIVEQTFKITSEFRNYMSKFNPMMFYDLQKYYPKAWFVFEDFRDRYCCPILQQCLKEGVRQGLFRHEINVDILVQLRIAELFISFDLSVFPPSKFNVSQVMIEVSEHFLYGLCTVKGYELMNTYKKMQE